MRALIFLADYIQPAPSDKLTAVGIGWTFIGPGPVEFAVGGVVEVPWTATNQKHPWTLTLLDGDGQPVSGPDGRPVQFGGVIEVGRPPGHPPGAPFNVCLGVNVRGLELPPGSRCEWVLTVDGETDENWRVGFNTRPRQPG